MTDSPATKNLLSETWEENRFVVKLLIGHTSLSIIFIGLLAGAHSILKRCDIEQERKLILDTIHFWGLISAFCLLLGGFIIEVILFIIQSLRRHLSSG
jgi:hypothetical protein